MPEASAQVGWIICPPQEIALVRSPEATSTGRYVPILEKLTLHSQYNSLQFPPSLFCILPSNVVPVRTSLDRTGPLAAAGQ